MKKYINCILHVFSIYLIFNSFLILFACQSKTGNTPNQHVENILSIEKAYYWNDVIQACINSNRYADAMPFLDSLVQYCNYYEEACYIYIHVYI